MPMPSSRRHSKRVALLDPGSNLSTFEEGSPADVIPQSKTLFLGTPKLDPLIQDQGVVGLGIGVAARVGQLMCR